MPEYQSEPSYQPRLRPHRLVPADAPLPEEQSALSAEPVLETWALAPGGPLPPEIAEAGRALAQRAWLVIEKAALTLDALPPILKAAEAPDEALETLKVIAAALLALPDQLAGGMDTSIARADRMFARLLNAPGKPGLIEQVMFALAHAGAGGAGEQERPDYAAELETLRRLHRDLVTLQLEWDDLLEPLFPEEEPSAALADEPVGIGDDAAGDTQPLPSLPTPLPDGLVVAVPASERARLPRLAHKQHLTRLALLIALLLFASGTGVLLVRHSHTPTLNPGSAVLSVGQQTPLAATSQPTSTQAAPTATPSPRPTAPPRAPTPPPRSPSPTPTSAPGAGCLAGATFCASAPWLQVPCASQGSISFQLTNTTNQKQNWQALSSPGPAGSPLVSISPASGHLKPHQTITVTVQTQTSGDDFVGMLTVSGAPGTLPLFVALAVCD